MQDKKVRKKIVAILGSTKSKSTNRYLVNHLVEMVFDDFEIVIFDEIDKLPHYNPDLDYDFPPQKVTDFRELLREADGIIISTPEYAMGVPGSLKNALDWTVSSCEFSRKPIALVTASTLGHKCHSSLIETLNILEASINENTQVLITHAKAKISEESITDEETLNELKKMIHAFQFTIQNPNMKRVSD